MDERISKTTTPELEELRKTQAAKKRPSADPTHILDKAIYQLWETINDLDQIQPERVEHYRVSIFGSSRIRRGDPIYEQVKKLSAELARMGVDIVTGGGPGLMEAANKGAYEGPSPSVGLNIKLPHEQGNNGYQDVSETFQHFFARKVMFVKLSVAFVMMPGGFGTLDELMEVLTLVQTGKIRRVPIILVNSGYWKGLLDWMNSQLVSDKMIGVDDTSLMQVIDDPQQVVDAIFDHYHGRGFEPSPAEREAELAL